MWSRAPEALKEGSKGCFFFLFPFCLFSKVNLKADSCLHGDITGTGVRRRRRGKSGCVVSPPRDELGLQTEISLLTVEARVWKSTGVAGFGG